MTVFCPSIECKHNGKRNNCTLERIELSWHSVMTVWDGRQEFWRCKNYEQSDYAKEILDQVKLYMEGKK